MIHAQSTCDDCGWRSKPTTPGHARRVLAAHSCERQRQRAAALAAIAAREAAIDRTPKPCHHKRVRHQHGTYACHTLDHCKCLPCAAAKSEYEAARTRRIAYGRWEPYVDASPARAHLQQLMAAGMGLKRVCTLSGLAHGTLSHIVWGRPRPDGTNRPVARIRPATAERILAVELDLAGGQLTDATGTRRRLQALIAVGYSKLDLAHRLGMTPPNAGRMLCSGKVTLATHRAVCELFDQLGFPPADTHRQRISVNRSRSFAAARGWVTAWAWDDETIDDPMAKPAGDQHYLADLVEAVAWHHRRGMSDREIGEALNRPADTIGTVRKRLGLPIARRGGTSRGRQAA